MSRLIRYWGGAYLHRLPFSRRIARIGAACLLLAPASAQGSGFRITNQSLEAVGLAGARIAATPGPDASYANPANLPYLPDQWQLESALTLLHLPAIEYADTRLGALDGSSDEELFYMPLVHLASPQYGPVRFGFSLTYPYGLAKQWHQAYPRATAEKFSLMTIEGNPSLAVSPCPWLSLAAGIRLVRAEGEIENTVGGALLPAPLTSLHRSLNGDDTALGYNLALTIRPTSHWSLAATFRSPISLNLKGSTDMQALAGPIPLAGYSGDSSLDLTLPAVFALAAAYSLERWTLELVWDRTYWSCLKNLDVQYSQNLLGTPLDSFDRSLAKFWKDADSYRIGLTYTWNDRWSSTLGLALEKTPVPDKTLGFELPDSDATMYSAGLKYRWSTTTQWGLSYMYYCTGNRSVSQNSGTSLTDIAGTFTEGGAHALTIGAVTTF